MNPLCSWLLLHWFSFLYLLSMWWNFGQRINFPWQPLRFLKLVLYCQNAIKEHFDDFFSPASNFLLTFWLCSWHLNFLPKVMTKKKNCCSLFSPHGVGPKSLLYFCNCCPDLFLRTLETWAAVFHLCVYSLRFANAGRRDRPLVGLSGHCCHW